MLPKEHIYTFYRSNEMIIGDTVKMILFVSCKLAAMRTGGKH